MRRLSWVIASLLSVALGTVLSTARVEALGGIIYAAPSTVEVGGTTTVNGLTFASGPVVIRIMGRPEVLTRAEAGRDGTFSVEVALPADITPEDYTLEAEGSDGSKVHTELRLVAALPNVAISVNALQEATAGQPVSVTATVRDRQGRPLPKTVVRFATTSRFLLDSRASDLLMDLGAAETDGQGIAGVSFSPGEAGPIQVVAYIGPSWDKRRGEGWSLLEIAPAEGALYTPFAGISFPPIGPLALALLIVAIFGVYMVVIRQAWGIGAQGAPGHPWIGYTLPALTLAGVAGLGVLLTWVVLTSPASHAQLSTDGTAPLFARRDVHPVGEPMVAASFLLPETDGIALGQAFYDAYCASCHGPTADGAVGPSLKKHERSVTEVEYLLRRGLVGRIPAFSDAQISEAGMGSLVAYLVSVGAAQAEERGLPAVQQVQQPTPAPVSPPEPQATATPTPVTTTPAPAQPTPTPAAALSPTPPPVAPTAPPTPAPTRVPPPSTALPPASFALKVSVSGFNGTGGDLFLPVTLNQEVQITFVYDDYDLAEDNPHNIGIEGYGIEVTVSRANPQAVVTFRATTEGEFNIACMNEDCQGHRRLQRGFLRVTSQ